MLQQRTSSSRRASSQVRSVAAWKTWFWCRSFIRDPSIVDAWTTQELGVPTPHPTPCSKKSWYNLWLYKNLSSLGMCGDPANPKSVDAQIPYIKWCRTLFTANSLHPQIFNFESKICFVLFFLIHGWLNLQMWNTGTQRADYLITERQSPH